jgi:two-component system sensor histidine kinase BaeS
VELLRPLAEERCIMIQSELVAAECPGDSQQLAQVVTNLLTNAILHSKHGGEARITTRRDQDDVVLTIADNGPGIPAEDLPRLFERFYRADKSRTGATGGTGLGLAISKAIIEAHGGSIKVISTVGSGTTFTVRLPVNFD